MQIHELPLNSGAPADTDAFALDTGSQTFKIDYNALADAILKKSLSAITSAGEYPVKSSVIYQRLLNTAWCFDNSAINTSGNATRAYSVGEYVVSQQNRFYRVKQAVASGEAWAVGTNLENAYVGDILEALNTLTATHTSQISQLNSKIVWNTTSETFSSRNQILNWVDSWSIGQGCFYGYITSQNASTLGLTPQAHFCLLFVNSDNYRMLLAIPTTPSRIALLNKSGGAWASEWRNASAS